MNYVSPVVIVEFFLSEDILTLSNGGSGIGDVRSLTDLLRD